MHQIPLCVACSRSSQHATHFHTSLESAWTALSADIVSARVRTAEVEATRAEQRQLASELRTRCDAAKAETRARFDEWRRFLAEREQELLADIERTCAEEERALQTQADAYLAHLNPLEREVLQVDEDLETACAADRERRQREQSGAARQQPARAPASALSSPTGPARHGQPGQGLGAPLLPSRIYAPRQQAAARLSEFRADPEAPWWFQFASVMLQRRRWRREVLNDNKVTY